MWIFHAIYDLSYAQLLPYILQQNHVHSASLLQERSGISTWEISKINGNENG